MLNFPPTFTSNSIDVHIMGEENLEKELFLDCVTTYFLSRYKQHLCFDRKIIRLTIILVNSYISFPKAIFFVSKK
jgi:hypothetical protein